MNKQKLIEAGEDGNASMQEEDTVEIVYYWLTATDGTLLRLRDIVTLKPVAVEGRVNNKEVWFPRLEVCMVTGKVFQYQILGPEHFDQQAACLAHAKKVLNEEILEKILTP